MVLHVYNLISVIFKNYFHENFEIFLINLTLFVVWVNFPVYLINAGIQTHQTASLIFPIIIYYIY